MLNIFQRLFTKPLFNILLTTAVMQEIDVVEKALTCVSQDFFDNGSHKSDQQTFTLL